ncbi:MAG TPA: hypothetical protein VNZ86_13615 [Bacteroidia bacterium]|jgi:hypothetical protein|nr:hypothetical protein [Bacteroidia bacterium]
MGFLATLEECIRAPFAKEMGLDPNIASKNYGKSPGFGDFFNNNAGTRLVPLYALDASDNLHVGAAVLHSARVNKTFDLATNASITSQAFWVADDTYIVTSISCVFATTDGAANTAFIAKATGTQAPGATTNIPMMVGTFNMNATANTVQNAVLPNWLAPSPAVTQNPAVQLMKGDRLVFNLASAVTNLAGVSITLELAPGNKHLSVDYVMNLNSSIATTALMVSNGSYIITGVQAVASTVGTNGGTVTGDVTIDTGTAAPGAGTSVLAAAFALNTAGGAVANTVQTVALSATAANLRINAGSRISFKATGTLTALAGLVVTVTYAPIQDAIDVSWTLALNANLAVNQVILTANRTYELIVASCTFATTNGSALTVGLTRESSTTAPGSGTSIQSGTFNLNSTANTTQVATLLSLPNNYLLAGDRLSLNFSTTVGSLAGAVVTVTLRPR